MYIYIASFLMVLGLSEGFFPLSSWTPNQVSGLSRPQTPLFEPMVFTFHWRGLVYLELLRNRKRLRLSLYLMVRYGWVKQRWYLTNQSIFLVRQVGRVACPNSSKWEVLPSGGFLLLWTASRCKPIRKRKCKKLTLHVFVVFLASPFGQNNYGKLLST